MRYNLSKRKKDRKRGGRISQLKVTAWKYFWSSLQVPRDCGTQSLKLSYSQLFPPQCFGEGRNLPLPTCSCYCGIFCHDFPTWSPHTIAQSFISVVNWPLRLKSGLFLSIYKKRLFKTNPMVKCNLLPYSPVFENLTSVIKDHFQLRAWASSSPSPPPSPLSWSCKCISLLPKTHTALTEPVLGLWV